MEKIPLTTAILQVLFGLAIAFWSWVLAGVKVRILTTPTKNGDYIILDSFPPSSNEEFILLGLSIAVFICGWFQWKVNIKGSLLQIILGFILLVIYLYLGINAANYPFEISGIYYVTYFSLALGLIIAVIGIVQLVQVVIADHKARLAEGHRM